MKKNTIPGHIFSSFKILFSPALKLSDHGRCSGGVVVLIKRSIINFVTVLTHRFDNIIAIKLKGLYSDTNKDTVLISAYIPPYNSPYYNNTDYSNGIVMLEQFIHNIHCSHFGSNIILCGDLNARISNIQPIEECERVSKYVDNLNTLYCYDMEKCTYSRKSEDVSTNGFGKSLIEMCAGFGLIVLNGINKFDASDTFTFISPHGNSVNDYFIVSEALFNNCANMCVHDRIESWHMPIALKLQIDEQCIPDCTKEIKYDRIVWENEKVPIYQEVIASTEIKNKIEHFKSLTPLDVINSILSFCDVIKECAMNMNKTITIKTGILKHKNKWFDQECKDRRTIVKASLRRYRSNRDDNERKTEYTNNRKEYKKLCKEKKSSHSAIKISTLYANINKPSFWDDLRSVFPKSINVNSIDTHQWYTFFKALFQITRPIPSICTEPPSLYPHINTDVATCILNKPITEEDVRHSIESLKKGKSPGPDNIVNEMLICAIDAATPFFASSFQAIFVQGIFLSDWGRSIIIPIHKKGDINSCDNYRPISLTSLVSKVYTNILNKRLTSYADAMNIIPEEQAGFRAGYSTIDHIFSLYAMITRQFSKNQKLYVAFIDYRKCFDSINREALFNVLERNGIRGNFLKAIQGIYTSLLSCVRNNGELSEYFECPIGLKQGCLLSPKLFSIFISEVSKYLDAHGKHGIQLIPGGKIIHHLLYADDNILVSDTPSGLQSKLNIIHSQSERLGLEVNLDKTKIIVFRKGGYLGRHESWHYGETQIEIVNAYSYLGVDFTTRMSFTSSTLPFVAKAKKASFEILRALYALECCNLHVFLKLFDSKVQPILSYGSELWGMGDNPEIEMVHTISLKRFLNVSAHCSNTTIYGDTGRYPLSICHKIKSIKYWFRLLKLPQSRINRQAYDMLYKLSETGKYNWVSNVRDLLCQNGFGYAWLFKGVGNEPCLLKQLKQRLCDCFSQNWTAKLTNSDNFQCYSNFKSIIQTEYFLYADGYKRHLRNALIKFRMGVSEINAHRHKFSANEIMKKCPFCKLQKEDELHVIFVCPVYEHLRNALLPERYVSQRNVNHMYILFEESSVVFAKYIAAVFTVRKKLLGEERAR